MKYLISICFLFIVSVAQGQQRTAFRKLLSQFSEAYTESAKDPSNNYFESLTYAFGVLRVSNPVAGKAKSEFKRLTSIKKEDTAVRRLADSILHVFVRDSFWNHYTAELSKYQKLLKMYTEKGCPCYTSKITGVDNLLSSTNQCEKEILNDKDFMTKFTMYLAEIPVGERLGVQKFASMYTYQNCPKVNEVMNGILISDAISHYLGDITGLAMDADFRAMKYSRENRLDSLALIFPGYKKAQDAIKKSGSFYTSENVKSFSTFEQKNSGKILRYFVTGLDMVGKVEYTYEPGETDVIITSFRFVPADKMTLEEKKKIEGWKNEIPPPIEKVRIGEINN